MGIVIIATTVWTGVVKNVLAVVTKTVRLGVAPTRSAVVVAREATVWAIIFSDGESGSVKNTQQKRSRRNRRGMKK